MITLTAHLENGKKYKFKIPEGYPWVEYNSCGVVRAWTKKPTVITEAGTFSGKQPNGGIPYMAGDIDECWKEKLQLQRIQFHD